MTLEIVQDIVSDILKGVEELLWPQKSLHDFVLPTITEDKPPMELSRTIRKDVKREISSGPLVEVCLQKYWFRISEGRQGLSVLGVELTSSADIKERNGEQISNKDFMMNID